MGEDGVLQVVGIPKLSRANKMGHSKLIRALKYCPVSDRFGEAVETLNSVVVPIWVARQQVVKLIVNSANILRQDIAEGASES